MGPVPSFDLLLPLSLAKLPVATRSFLSSPCTNFDSTDFCHLRRGYNLFLLICLFNFWPELLLMFCFASIQLRPISDYDICPRPSSQEDRILAAWSKNKHQDARDSRTLFSKTNNLKSSIKLLTQTSPAAQILTPSKECRKKQKVFESIGSSCLSKNFSTGCRN